MKISKTFFILFIFILCILRVTSDKLKGDEKIKFQIELLNKDKLLSSPHLKIKKSIIHNGKKINIKLFEKINENVLERAYIVEEVDKTKSLTKNQKHELLTLKNEDTEEDNTKSDEEDTDIENENMDDENMKVVSTEESQENDIHMIRKVYKQLKGNKEITYCYMIFTFNLDLEKLSEISRSELYKSLDSMPDYLTFLSPEEKTSDTENLLEEEYEKSSDGSVKNSTLGGISAVELSQKSDELKVNILKYIRALDNIINYFINESANSSERPAFFKTLLKERAYLYKLSTEKTENEDVVNEGYWKNKSKIEKYILYEALTQLSTIYFTGMIKNTYDSKLDNTTEHDKFIDLIEKSIQCHSLLDNTEILDVMILQKLDISRKQSDNENKADKKLIEQCLSLFKVLLSKKDESVMGKKYKILLMNNNETKNELNEISEESFPVDNYMYRKETSDIEDIIEPIENSNSKLEDDEENLDLIDSDENEIEENDVEGLYDDIESEIEEEKSENQYDSFLQNNGEVITGDISNEMFNEYPEIAKETEEEHDNEIFDVINVEKQKNIGDDINSPIEEDINTPIEKDIKPHHEMSTSYLENTSMIKDDDDDEDDNMFSFDDDTDIFSDEDTTEDDYNETSLENDDEEDVEDDDETTLEDDNDDDEDEEEDSFEDDSDDNDVDLDEEDNEDGNETFTDKIKKTLKKQVKNVVKTGKEMGKKTLNNLIDKAEGHVQKLTTKLTKKAKDKLNGKKNKKNSKKSKKNKKEVNEKKVKKTNSKGNKKTKKNVKSNDENLRSSSTSKSKGKKKKLTSSSSVTISKKNKKLRKPNKKGSFIDLTSETSKLSSNIKMKKTLAKVASEIAALKSKKVQLLKDLEKPTVSDEKIMEDFKNYEKNLKNKKEAHIREL